MDGGGAAATAAATAADLDFKFSFSAHIASAENRVLYESEQAWKVSFAVPINLLRTESREVVRRIFEEQRIERIWHLIEWWCSTKRMVDSRPESESESESFHHAIVRPKSRHLSALRLL